MLCIMKCPYCFQVETKVVDKRGTENLNVARRRRECTRCKKRFTTYERVEMRDLMVIKKDGRREQFDRVKLMKGLQKSCEKRPISIEMIEKILDSVELELRNHDNIEVSSSIVGDLIMDNLKILDPIAYIRFASVYREFQDVTDFKKELKEL